jgi:hypothetical protein
MGEKEETSKLLFVTCHYRGEEEILLKAQFNPTLWFLVVSPQVASKLELSNGHGWMLMGYFTIISFQFPII